VVDANGTVVPDATAAIQFSAQGAELIGDNPVKAEAGIATILLKMPPTAGSVKITGQTAGLSSNSLRVTSK
jgi:beta-galactosidase